MERKKKAVVEEKSKEIVEVNSFEDWIGEVSEYKEIEISKKKVLRFKGYSLSGEQMEKINSECKPSLPPKTVPRRNPKGEVIKPVVFDYDFDDENYKKQCEELAKKKITMTIEIGLKIKIKGETYKEKYKSLLDKRAGDPVKLFNWIWWELSNLKESDVNSFIEA